MADNTNLIEILKLQYKEQMEKQDRQHAEQMAVLIAQVKSRDVNMKHLIEAACDGTKGSSTPAASFKPFDSNSELWLDYMERFRTHCKLYSQGERSSSVPYQPDYSNLQDT